MDTKICYKCKKELPVEDFKKHKGRKDGLQADCIACQKEYRRNHYEKNKEKYIERAKRRNKRQRQELESWLREQKRRGKCAKCGEKHPACLHYHHRDESQKEFNIGEAVGRAMSLKRVQKEVAKCVLYCSNCHLKWYWRKRNRKSTESKRSG